MGKRSLRSMTVCGVCYLFLVVRSSLGAAGMLYRADVCLLAQFLVVVDETALDDDALVQPPQKHPRTIAQSYRVKSARSSLIE